MNRVHPRTTLLMFRTLNKTPNASDDHSPTSLCARNTSTDHDMLGKAESDRCTEFELTTNTFVPKTIKNSTVASIATIATDITKLNSAASYLSEHKKKTRSGERSLTQINLSLQGQRYNFSPSRMRPRFSMEVFGIILH